MNNSIQTGSANQAVLIKSLVDDLTAINQKIIHLSINEVLPAIYAGELSPL